MLPSSEVGSVRVAIPTPIGGRDRPGFGAHNKKPGDELLGSDPAVVQAALRRLALASAPATFVRERYRLTRREVDVAFMLAVGKSNSEIASALSISEHTSRHHTERVLTKLGVRSRAAVAASLGQIGQLRETG